MTHALSRLVLSAALAAPASACGDDLVSPGGTGSGADAGGDRDAATGATLFAVATDYVSTGIATSVDLPSLAIRTNVAAGVASTDPVVRHQDGRLFIINRFQHDNVTALRADTFELIAQVSTGPGSNPQDVIADGDTLYVATLAGSGLAVVHLDDPSAPPEPLELDDLDPDGHPNCHTLALFGRTLAVVCGILDDTTFTPRGPGQVYLVDIDQRRSARRVALGDPRPFGFGLFTPADSAIGAGLLVPSAPSFAEPASAGGIDRVTIDPGPGAATVSRLVSNADLGGFASALAYDATTQRIWITVTAGFDPDDFGPVGTARAWDLSEGRLTEPLAGASVRPIDVAVCPSGHVALSDATRGVRVYAPSGGEELTSAPLDLGLPPVSNGSTCY